MSVLAHEQELEHVQELVQDPTPEPEAELKLQLVWALGLVIRRKRKSELVRGPWPAHHLKLPYVQQRPGPHGQDEQVKRAGVWQERERLVAGARWTPQWLLTRLPMRLLAPHGRAGEPEQPTGPPRWG